MAEWLKGVWKDSVWSKVIGALITGVIVWGWTKAQGFDWLQTYPIPIWVIPSAFLVIGIVTAILSNKSKPQGPSEPKQGVTIPLPPSPSAPGVSIAEQLTILDTVPVSNPSWSYPLKYYIHFRNDSAVALDVIMMNYVPGIVELQKKVFDVLQVKFGNTYSPNPDGVTRVAVYPGQMMQLWLGLDPAKYSTLDVEKHKGKLGTLTLSVNGQNIAIKL